MGTNLLTRRLASSHRDRQQYMRRAADRAAMLAERAVAGIWADLVGILERGPSNLNYLAALHVLRSVPLAITAAMRRSLLVCYYTGHRHAVASVLDVVPHEALVPAHVFREAVDVPGSLTVSFRGLSLSPIMQTLTGAEPLPRDEARELLQRMLFEPPPEPDILAWLDKFIRPASWTEIGTDTDKRLPADIAGEISLGFSQGKSAREVAKDIRPYLDGSRMRARRAARTFGMHVGHSGQVQAWQGLGDLLIGYQIHSAKVWSSRWWHKQRDGEIYYVNPGPGQKGMLQCPHPPMEADDASQRPAGTPRIAWNCLCWLTPVLRMTT